MQNKLAWVPAAALGAVTFVGAIWVAARVEVVSDTACGRLLRPNNLHSPVCADFYRRHWVAAGLLLFCSALLALAALWLRHRASPDPN